MRNMVFWYVTIDHSAFSTLRENPQVDNKPPRLFGSVPGGGSPLNHWLSREGTTKMQKGQFMDPLYEAFPSSNRSKLIVWDRTYLPILLIWASISPPPPHPWDLCSRRQRGQAFDCLRRLHLLRDPRAKQNLLCVEICTWSVVYYVL